MFTRRGSRTDAASNSDSARVKSSVFPLETQCKNAEFLHRKLTGSESPAEHIRNALHVLLSTERELGDGVVLFDARDVDAIEHRLDQAPEQLEESPAPRLVIDELRCIHCGCTDKSACLVAFSDFAPPERAEILAYWSAQNDGAPVNVPMLEGAEIGTFCWWISQDPPVCSNPVCADAHRRARAAGITP